MHRKLFMLIAALLLVLTTSVAPMKVAAQGLVEYARILALAMVGVGPNEAVEFYYVVREVPPDNATAQRGGIVHTYTLTVSNAGPSDAQGQAACQQTIPVPMVRTAGLRILNVSKEGAELLINGEEVPLEGKCLIDANRVALAFGYPFPPGTAQQQASDRGFDAEFALQLARHFVGYSIVNLTSHKTAASGGATNSITFFDSQGRETSN